ncbi:heme peroxidase [Fimicolochytrium jonesii]|uniref:heme peroxidase n=1 Tax=Fimicolochytrium jonesii TaxID=1396493 RepID=UPI0022FDEF91|nr:heme peroxidase [Fimicolochytrium jonesii]KAI8822852.1 heme peroxidase [Fimicolochytrium jonesii]
MSPKGDYAAVKKDIASILDKPDYDDGSLGPIFVRLAWHASGTYDKKTRTGGSNGATMRFDPEVADGANAGLEHARAFLEPIKQKHPWISYADLWTLAGATAIEEMGGPTINWKPGRSDKDPKKLTAHDVPPNGRLPDAALGQDHVRQIFYRMGFDDREIVALVGAHALGRCHADRSGYEGPWTHTPTRFSNQYFKLLTGLTWRKKEWDGPVQYTDEDDELMMLPADMAVIRDPEFAKIAKEYAQDKDVFFKDFAAAFEKLIDLGVPRGDDKGNAPVAPNQKKAGAKL